MLIVVYSIHIGLRKSLCSTFWNCFALLAASYSLSFSDLVLVRQFLRFVNSQIGNFGSCFTDKASRNVGFKHPRIRY
ncbi:unnamed protein product [Hymenolepis diminuta]|uniref:Uncharacterized protein n=1 Tax=Hymenolepis diminuta TaxID=6216 RepID=A0A564YNX7_HYMDI|nr:unnamed protein product [Hymenolepis diminuta]